MSCREVNILHYYLLTMCYVSTTIILMAIVAFRINIASVPMVHSVLFCNSVVLYFESITCLQVCPKVECIDLFHIHTETQSGGDTNLSRAGLVSKEHSE